MPLFPFSVHRFSHATMPFRNIFKKYAFHWVELVIGSCWFSSFHYHILSGTFFSRLSCSLQTRLSTGLFLAYPIYGPTYAANSGYITGTRRSDPLFLWTCAGIWLVRPLPLLNYPTGRLRIDQFAELSNLATHLTLRNLRPPGSKKRAIPHGYGFGLLSCPNYFFESVAWSAVACATGSWAGAS